MLNNTFLLRIATAGILLMHSIPGMFNNGINDFGNFYLDEIGFSPVGVPLAWAIKLSHVLCALCLLFNKFTKPAAILTILILIAGIILVHFKEGWFVVGAGRNGIEFNFLLIVVLITILLPKGLKKNTTT
ncbi:MAG: DoxX family membrane protein [Chitinophagaceae bacterium]|nr:DoxX family membrane protein [Chitinophagaceae bacterium]MBK7123217.1 DoxX family membrane protein [Chitinophagaceae bacterium]MBK7557057.1 DoxX family membrane protein [Chitinophagaceae bacterium]MBK9532461.1 DoxX family membrane protein [Chitinophagaceae bacterium]